MKSKLLSAMLALSCGMATSGAYAQTTTLYVDATAASGGNGYTWGTALRKVSDALDSAWANPNIGEIRVAKGTYSPAKKPYVMGSNKKGTVVVTSDSRDKVFHVRAGLQLIGGYPSGGGARNAATNVTRLRGLTGGEEMYHVVLINRPALWGNITDVTVVDGFTIDYGNANGTGSLLVNGDVIGRASGGGMAIYNTNYIVANNRITANDANASGAGLYTYRGKGKLTGNTITNNKVYYSGVGGGYAGLEAKTNAQNNKIENNEADGGAGVYSALGRDTFIYNSIINNDSRFAAGIFFSEPSYNVVYSNVIAANTATSHGGGILINKGKTTIIGNLIDGNKAGTGGGGGISIHNVDWVIEGVSIINNTISNNQSTGIGGGIRSYASDVVIANNILWKNKLGNSYAIPGADWSDVTALDPSCTKVTDVDFYKNRMQLPASSYTYANNNRLETSVNNYYATNPMFVNESSIKGMDGIYGTADDGLRLSANSPFIDAGYNQVMPPDYTVYTIPAYFLKDVTGGYRGINQIDLGAYEVGNPIDAKITSISKTSFCEGDSVVVSYTCSNIQLGNTFTVQISSEDGIWGSNPRNIGTVVSNTNGTITVQIPEAFLSSNKYRMRLIASAPYMAFDDNGIDLALHQQVPFYKAKIYPTTTVQFCDGASASLYVLSDAALTYQWSKNGNVLAGATGTNYTITDGGSYMVTAADVNGCAVSSLAKSVTVKPLPTGAFAVNAINNSNNKQLVGAFIGGTYQWYKDGNIITGATSRYYTATATGNYNIVVTKNGCTTVGAAQNVVIAGSTVKSIIAETSFGNGAEMSVYPNPSNSASNILISDDANSSAYEVNVYDVAGRIVETVQANTGSSVSFGTALPAGMYTIVATSGDKKMVTKWMKQ